MAGEAVSDAETNRDAQPSKHALCVLYSRTRSAIALWGVLGQPTRYGSRAKYLAKGWGLANIGWRLGGVLQVATLLSNTLAGYFNTRWKQAT